MFREQLQRMVEQVDGGQACILMGFDGISLDSYVSPTAIFDVQSVGLEYSVVLSQIRKTASLLEAGAVQEIAISSERFVTLMRVLSDDYFMAMILSREGNYGKGRYVMRMGGPLLARDL
jgi:predicted regulator of Ras-like GTPase activity (Roadblock/LC7/MglB family)